MKSTFSILEVVISSNFQEIFY